MIILSTDRLLFREWTQDDFPAVKKLWGDPEVLKYTHLNTLLSDQEIQNILDKHIDRQKEFGVSYWAVELKESGEVIGACGLRPYKLDEGVYELGYFFCKDHWGKGYAGEAARGVIEHAFGTMNVPKLFGGHHPENKVSSKVLLKLGFTYIGDEFYEPTGLDHPSYELVNGVKN